MDSGRLENPPCEDGSSSPDTKEAVQQGYASSLSIARPASPIEPVGGSPRAGLLLPALIFAVSALVAATYWPVLSARAISFDDNQYLIDNPLVRTPGWASAGRFMMEVSRPSTVAGYYQPLTMISLMLDCALGGSPDDFRPFHRTSLMLHLLNTGLLVVLLYLLFGEPWVAAAGGLLFGLHPLNVEAIATIGERKTVLSPFFAFGCMILYVQYARHAGKVLYVASLAAYLLALLAKPISMPLPVMLLLLDVWPLGRWGRRAVIEKVPFLAMGGLFGIITVISQGQFAPVPVPGDYPLVRVPLILCHGLIFYLQKIAWPVHLSVHYPYPDPLGMSNPAVAAGVLATCLLVPLVVVSLRWTPALAIGMLCFLVALFPTMGLVGFSVVLTSDKYVYLPFVGLLIPLSWSANEALRRASPARRAWAGRTGGALVVCVLGCLLAAATRRTLEPWKDTVSLHKHMRALAPRAVIVHNNLAMALMKQGRTDEAIESLREALRVNPRYGLAHRNLADALLGQGDVDGAITHYAAAARLEPNLPIVHFRLGTLLLSRGRLDEASSQLRAALALKPDLAEAHNNLGSVLLRQSQVPEAVAHFREALRLRPDLAGARQNLERAEALR
jgi:protein O-mannosyl-transferase